MMIMITIFSISQSGQTDKILGEYSCPKRVGIACAKGSPSPSADDPFPACVDEKLKMA
jgi:hypothetical protein